MKDGWWDVPLTLQDLALSNLHHSPGLTLGIFPFLVALQDIFFCITMPQYLAASMHLLDTRLTNSQAATHESRLVGCSPHTPGLMLTIAHSPFCSQWWFPGHQVPAMTLLCQWTHLQQIFTQAVAKNYHPSSTVNEHAPAPPFPHAQFPSFKTQLTLPAHKLVIPLPHCFYTPLSRQ